MRRTTSWRLLALGTTMVLGAAACGRSDTTSEGDTEGTTNGSSTETSTGGEAGGAFINPDEDCDAYEGTKGIEGDTIKVGTVRPAQGPYVIYDTITVGLESYFKFVNEKGGVKGGDGKSYKIELVKEDDQYDPGKTPDAVKKLVEQEGVFAMVGSVGTETNLAVRDYLNDNCVPSISLATGSPQWGDANAYPWYIGGLPSYATEAVRFMQFLTEENPEAKLAVLYQNDDFGKSHLAAIEKFIKDNDSKITIADSKGFDPASGQTTQGVTTQLAQSKADAFFVGIGGTPCPATLGFMPADWKPLTYVSVPCSGKLALALAGGKDEGVYSAQATYDPANPEDMKTPAVTEYTEALTKQGLTDIQITGGVVSAGWGFGAIFAKGVELADTVDRAGVMNALYAMEGETIGLMREGVTGHTSNDADPWILEQLRIVHREGGQWVEASPLVDFDGKSNDFGG